MTRCRSAATGLVWAVALVLVVAGGRPAGAAHDPAHLPVIVITDPGSDGVAFGGAVSGYATMNNLLLAIDSIRVDIVAVSGSGPAQGFSVCTTGGCGYDTLSDRRHFSVPTSFPYNGTYRATVTAVGLPLLSQPRTAQATRTFTVANPAAPPTGVEAEVSGDRTVVVSWNRVTAHPDTTGYVVHVKGPGDSAFGSPVGLAQPSSGARVSHSQPVTDEGGTYEFQVRTIRPGAVASDPAGAVFSPAGSAKVSVEPLATSTSSEPVTTTAAPPTSPPATNPAADSGQIGGFLDGAIRNAPPPPRPTIPDTGFDSTLPFDLEERQRQLEGRIDGALSDQEGSGRVTATVAEEPADNQRRLLVPIAGGAVLCMVALHLRYLSRRFSGPVAALDEAEAETEAQPWDFGGDPGPGPDDGGYGGVGPPGQEVAYVDSPVDGGSYDDDVYYEDRAYDGGVYDDGVYDDGIYEEVDALDRQISAEALGSDDHYYVGQGPRFFNAEELLVDEEPVGHGGQPY